MRSDSVIQYKDLKRALGREPTDEDWDNAKGIWNKYCKRVRTIADVPDIANQLEARAYVQARLASKKAWIAEQKTKCTRCGYFACKSALHFHHIDPSTKKATVSEMTASNSHGLPALILEVEKCILLCANCHAEYHEGLWEM